MSDQPMFMIEAINVRRAVLDVSVPPKKAPPRIGLNMNFSNTHAIDEADATRAVATVSVAVTAKGDDGAVVFNCEVTADAHARMENIPETEKANMLSVFLPNQVIPYLREAVGSLTARSGYQAVTLPPIMIQPNQAGPN